MAAPSTYERRLHEVHLKVLHNWRDLLTQPGMRTDTLGAAFAGVLDEGGDWRGAVAAGEASVAQLALPRLFPRLAPLVAKGYLEGLVAAVADAVVANTQAELGVIVEERGLPARFRELEKRVEAARRGVAGGGGAGAGASSAAGGAAALALAAQMPEDEVRGIAMEAKRGYEQQLRAQLESLRRENADLERDVAAADERARQIKQGVDAKVKALSELGAVADGLRGLGDV
jgi:hypothetical protein